MDIAIGIIRASFVLLAEMAPYLLIGIAAAGAIHMLLPESWVAKKLGGGGLYPSFRAALFGVPLPLCSCGVVPVAASLKKSGAGTGATVSFLITTPTSGVDSILATYSLLGAPFAAARVVASFVIGLVAGIVTTLTGPKETVAPPADRSSPKMDRQRLGSSFRTGLRYGFDELLGGMTKSLLLGTVLGGIIAFFVPPGALGAYVGGGLIAYLAMMAFGVPLYVCASGSIPLAAALMAKGVSPGAALVFLIAGPATNAATMGVILKFLGKRALSIFLSCIALGSVAAGWLMDILFARWPVIQPAVMHAHDHDTLGITEITAGLLLGAMLLYHLLRPTFRRFGQPKKRAASHMTKITVPDMTCNHCASTITQAVTGIDGVKNVFADPGTKVVEVEGGDAETVLNAIEAAGFSPTRQSV